MSPTAYIILPAVSLNGVWWWGDDDDRGLPTKWDISMSLFELR